MRLLQGFGVGGVSSTSSLFMSESFPSGARSKLNRSLAMFSSVGYFIGAFATLLVMGLSSQSDGWRDLNGFLGSDADVKSVCLYSAFILAMLLFAVIILFKPLSRFGSEDDLDVAEDSVWESIQEGSSISDHMHSRRLPRLPCCSFFAAGMSLCLNFLTILSFSFLEAFIIPFVVNDVQWSLFNSVMVFASWGLVCVFGLILSWLLSLVFSDFLMILFGFVCGAVGSFIVWRFPLEVKVVFSGIALITLAIMIVNASVAPLYSKILGPGPQKLRVLLFGVMVMAGRAAGALLAISTLDFVSLTFRVLFFCYVASTVSLLLFFKCLCPSHCLLESSNHTSSQVHHANHHVEDSRTPIILLPHSFPGLVLDREFSYFHLLSPGVVSINGTSAV
eukprot:TRINITY_DN50327_c0_g1_i1.p1 TRINITY_DN50327_c0_g1~~TRINITY_DN50327_c0_g1_i1.p1  ORF type:complete len:391 (+),score=67.35 TRINITY_DN50327_c0_g1_i1:300-1472(+)